MNVLDRILVAELTPKHIDEEKFTDMIAKAFKKHKKVAGITNVRQNYKGTGSKRARRQLYIKFDNGAVIDIVLSPESVQYMGVVAIRADGKRIEPQPRGFKYENMKVADIGKRIADDLASWSVEIT